MQSALRGEGRKTVTEGKGGVDMERYKNLTLLHSNDMHGDFLSEKIDDVEVGGISMLCGYVRKIKAEMPNSLYCISGDMLQGSLIDTEFRGLSTIDIMNYLGPDVVSLGNHEIDYGLGHLLLLERCSKFPIVNANLFIKSPYTRLFRSHILQNIGGMKIMFIGIITSEVLSSLRQDSLLGSLVDVEEAAKEVGRICDAYRTTDVDLTVLMTHIGFEEDKRLAELLDPYWGVDVIIGGHSHTVLEKPAQVNGVLIVQAAVGTDQIGRFDIVVDTHENVVSEYSWELIPIDESHCPRDRVIEKIILDYKEHIDTKYDFILCNFARELTHPSRYEETEVGNLFCDALHRLLETDIVMLGSGSIRKTTLGPVLTRRALLEMMPFEEKIYRLMISGRQFKHMYEYMVRKEAFEGKHTEFYQFSKGVSVEYDRRAESFIRFDFMGKPLEDDIMLSVGVQGFHCVNFHEFFDLPFEEIEKNGKATVVTTSVLNVLEEYFSQAVNPDATVEGRLILH